MAIAGKSYDRAWMTVSGSPGTGNVTLNAAYTNAYLSFANAGVKNLDKITVLFQDGLNVELSE